MVVGKERRHSQARQQESKKKKNMITYRVVSQNRWAGETSGTKEAPEESNEARVPEHF